jgi:uncharacterized protein YndB with AHSA1/START domain
MPRKKKGADDHACRSMLAEHETTIDARTDRVWRALTDEIGRWWNPGFHALPNTRMRLEPVVGGRLYEWADDGSAVVWATVIGIEPGRSLDLAGHLSVSFGGPAVVLIRFDVEAKGTTSVVRVSESRVGLVSDDAAASAKKGWSILLDAGLKPYAEKT